jgi:hypothetical protein
MTMTFVVLHLPWFCLDALFIASIINPCNTPSSPVHQFSLRSLCPRQVRHLSNDTPKASGGTRISEGISNVVDEQFIITRLGFTGAKHVLAIENAG